MSEFDARAREWDSDKMHMDRSVAIAAELVKIIPSRKPVRAMEYGAGTGILSFLLKDKFSEIVLMDSSKEMIRVCEEKKEYFKASNIKPLWFDLEQNNYKGRFDFIYCQMVLHHVNNVESILGKFYSLLNPGGILSIADLYPEDGSFHGVDIKVHLGFDTGKLIETLSEKGFLLSEQKNCFSIERPNGRKYPVFLISTSKK